MADDDLDRLVDRADLDGLIRLVDTHCDERDWDRLRRLGDAARAAVRTGRQLWPAATLAEYRLALLAPAPWAAAVIADDAGRFAIGPLTEVVAQHHTWSELAPHLAPGPARAFVAHERVVRGEAVDEPALPAVLDLPLRLQPWEPDYPLAVYEADGAHFDPPTLPTAVQAASTRRGATLLGGDDTDDVRAAVRALVEPWTAASNGRAEVVGVEGGVLDALGALGPAEVRLAELGPADALAWLGWAGGSGGAHGRRRGAATGRFGAWWTVAAIAGLLDDWPLHPSEVGEVAGELRWWWWDAYEPAVGWRLQLAVADPVEGVAWALHAHDVT